MPRVARDATAVSLRTHSQAMHLLTVWEESDPEPHVDWTRKFCSAMQPYSAGSVYVNVLAADDGKGIPEAYGSKLREVRCDQCKNDPSNVFGVNHNIRPSNAVAD